MRSCMLCGLIMQVNENNSTVVVCLRGLHCEVRVYTMNMLLSHCGQASFIIHLYCNLSSTNLKDYKSLYVFILNYHFIAYSTVCSFIVVLNT